MNCIKCGNPLPDGAGFCTACGTPQNKPEPHVNLSDNTVNSGIRPPEIYMQPPADGPTTTFKPKKKGSFLKVLVVLVLALVLVSGVTVLSYFTFLPAKYTLMVAEYSSVLENYDTFDKNMAKYEEKVSKPRFEDTISQKTELSVSIEDSLLEQLGVPPETIELVSKALKSVSIKYGYGLDARNKQQTINIGVNPFLNLDVFLDNTRFGLSVPELTSKTVVGDLKELDKLAEIYPDIDPTSLEAFKNIDPWISTRIYDDIKIDREDIKKAMLDYSRAMIDSIDSKDMSIKRGQKTKVLGKEASCQEITIKLDQKAQKKIFTNLLSKLEDDKNIYDLTAGNIIKISEILGENEVYQQMLQGVDLKEELSRDNFKSAIADIRENLDETQLPEEINAKIYIKGLDVVKYELDFTTGTPEEDVLWTIETLSNGLSFEQNYTLTGGVQDNKGELALNIKQNYDEASDTNDLLVDFSADVDMPDEKGSFSFSLNSDEKPDGKNSVDHTIDASFKVDMMSYEVPTKGEITFKMDGDLTKNSKGFVTEADYTGEIGMNVPDQLPQPIKAGFAVKTEAAYGEKLAMPKPEETLDISTAGQADYDELMNEINEKIGSLFMLFGGY